MDVCELWLEQLTAAYLIARGERVNELESRQVKRFSGSLHPFSYTYGQSTAYFQQTGLPADLCPTAADVRNAAARDGTARWLLDVAAPCGEQIAETVVRVFVAGVRSDEAARKASQPKWHG